MKGWLEGLQKDKVEECVTEQSVDTTVKEIVQLLGGASKSWATKRLDTGLEVVFIGIEDKVTWSQDLPPQLDIQIHKFTVWREPIFGKHLTHVANEWRNIDNDSPVEFSRFCAGLRLLITGDVTRHF